MLFAVFLLMESGPKTVIIIFLILTATEMLSSLIAAYYATCFRKVPDRISTSFQFKNNALTMLAIILSLGIFVYLGRASLVPVFQDCEFTILSSATLAGCLVVSKIFARSQGSVPFNGMFRYRFLIFPLVALTFSQFHEMNGLFAVLSLLVTLGLIFAISCFSRGLVVLGLVVSRKTSCFFHFHPSLLARLVSSSTDIVIFAFFLESEHFTVYLATRGSLLLLPLSLSFLQKNAVDLQLGKQKFRSKDRSRAYSARLNLGLFLVGGGIAIFALAFGKLLANAFFSVEKDAFLGIFAWLLLGSSVKAIFGCFESILGAEGRGVFVANCHLLMAVGMICFAVVFEISSEEHLAKCFALFHISFGAIGSGIVAYRYGIWPGPTALLLRQIRLL